ncbi:MAG: type IV pili methyl-accepting chemotaxis transducer N-terminal domain-containing protein [Gammaproteobacteria bacterium]|nr:type IV pili methyl-accepting chemotaxis transducer N-terminal domain-containing protein [Gammaproteobacteria bacterium]
MSAAMADVPQMRRRKSLLLRVGIAMATITALAVIGMVSSVFIARTLEGFAAAINQAGTLRMQSYRIASSLSATAPAELMRARALTRGLVEEYNSRLFSPRIHKVLEKGASARVVAAYNAVEQRWQQQMEPPLRIYTEAGGGERGDDQRAYYLAHVDGFVQDIHRFVKVLEVDAEEKNRQLHLIQLISLILTLLVVFVTLYLTHTRVLLPLRGLLACANAARRRDFSVRSQHLGDDELGQLGSAFNLMAEDLSKVYEDLEQRVREKTAHLEQSNRSLELLYATSRRLSESSPTVEVLTELVQDIERLTGCREASICLGHPEEEQAFRLTSTQSGREEGSTCHGTECAHCFGSGKAHYFESEAGDGLPPSRFLSIPIRDQEQQYGALVLRLAEAREQGLEAWQKRLLESIATHIAIAISMARQAAQSRMLSLQEERSVIARELHDSLAQSLSYLKIQVSRLEKEIRDQRDQESILRVSQMLRKGLNGAYRQLRELLTTFRLRINQEGLSAALEDTVNEYRERSVISIDLVDRIAHCEFNPNAEIHIIQIVREALSNVLRHSNATHASVEVACDNEGQVSVVIDDDGIGLGEEAEMLQHYGLPIMQERAEWLGGKLTIGESPSGGTRVKLIFSVSDAGGSPSHSYLVRGM